MRTIAILVALTLAACGVGPLDIGPTPNILANTLAVQSQPIQFIGPTPVRVVR